MSSNSFAMHGVCWMCVRVGGIQVCQTIFRTHSYIPHDIKLVHISPSSIIWFWAIKMTLTHWLANNQPNGKEQQNDKQTNRITSTKCVRQQQSKNAQRNDKIKISTQTSSMMMKRWLSLTRAHIFPFIYSLFSLPFNLFIYNECASRLENSKLTENGDDITMRSHKFIGAQRKTIKINDPIDMSKCVRVCVCRPMASIALLLEILLSEWTTRRSYCHTTQPHTYSTIACSSFFVFLLWRCANNLLFIIICNECNCICDFYSVVFRYQWGSQSNGRVPRRQIQL